jgi:hypothetical protein
MLCVFGASSCVPAAGLSAFKLEPIKAAVATTAQNGIAKPQWRGAKVVTAPELRSLFNSQGDAQSVRPSRTSSFFFSFVVCLSLPKTRNTDQK